MHTFSYASLLQHLSGYGVRENIQGWSNSGIEKDLLLSSKQGYFCLYSARFFLGPPKMEMEKVFKSVFPLFARYPTFIVSHMQESEGRKKRSKMARGKKPKDVLSSILPPNSEIRARPHFPFLPKFKPTNRESALKRERVEQNLHKRSEMAPFPAILHRQPPLDPVFLPSFPFSLFGTSRINFNLKFRTGKGKRAEEEEKAALRFEFEERTRVASFFNLDFFPLFLFFVPSRIEL